MVTPLMSNFVSTGWRQTHPNLASQWFGPHLARLGRPTHHRAWTGWLWTDGDFVRDDQQVSARDRLQPDVLWGQDSGASSDRLLLAAALVPGYSGPGTGWDSVHHHYLHPEVMRPDDVWSLLFFCALLILMAVWIGMCASRGAAVDRAVLLCSYGQSEAFSSPSKSKAWSILQDYLVWSLSKKTGSGLLCLLLWHNGFDQVIKRKEKGTGRHCVKWLVSIWVKGYRVKTRTQETELHTSGGVFLTYSLLMKCTGAAVIWLQ